MPLIWIASAGMVLAAVLVVVALERGIRKGVDAASRPPRGSGERLVQPTLAPEAKAAGWRAFRGWGWAGAILLVAGAALLGFTGFDQGFTPNFGLTLAVIASGVLAWTLGGGIGVTRAFDPPEGPGRRAEPRREPGRPRGDRGGL
ncbi:hypothetical protein USB125703_00810 [Pseudoclavibacter triregionum]|nr:hypothetical protein USB125703_00810 [Pseudoclavibacter triregionum]